MKKKIIGSVTDPIPKNQALLDWQLEGQRTKEYMVVARIHPVFQIKPQFNGCREDPINSEINLKVQVFPQMKQGKNRGGGAGKRVGQTL